MKVCHLVIGPAGSGKSTFCETMKLHCDAANRIIHLVNLDPAAEDCKYPVSVDIRELISLEDAMEECELGPNGGLLFCLEYLEENVEWLMEALEPYGEEDYLLIDCPGQIEAYSHLSVFKTVVRRYVRETWSRDRAGLPALLFQICPTHLSHWPASCSLACSLSSDRLQSEGWTVGCVYCLDAQFSEEASKYVAGSLNALTAMVRSRVGLSSHSCCFSLGCPVSLVHISSLAGEHRVAARKCADKAGLGARACKARRPGQLAG